MSTEITFPSRVWEPTGQREGRTLWASRAATPEDKIRRAEVIAKFRDMREARDGEEL